MFFIYVLILLEMVKTIQLEYCNKEALKTDHYIWKLVSSVALLFLARKRFMTSIAFGSVSAEIKESYIPPPLYIQAMHS